MATAKKKPAAKAAGGRKTISLDVKNRAIELIQKGEKSLAEIGSELKVSYQTILNYKKKLEGGVKAAREAVSGPGHSTPINKEVAFLRAENDYLREIQGITDEKERMKKEIEFLRKQVAILSA